MVGLVDYYRDFVPSRFSGRGGKPPARRTAQKYAKQFNLPIIDVGDNKLIDPDLADDRLREYARRQSEPRRPGRPRNTA